jgi:hypothetical protein
MVKQIRYLLFVFLFGTISCLPPKTTVNAFRNKYYCHCEKEKGLSDLLNLNGYYSMSEAISYNYGFPSQIVHDTIERNTIFYNNGIILYSFYKEKFQKDKDKKFGFYNRGMALWGSYIIQNDTIKAVFSQNPGGMSWSIGYVWFEIIDSTSIREIYFKWREPITKEDILKTYLNDNNNIAVFVNYDMLPNPDKSWLKQKKWFWCNEEDWRNYMDSVNLKSKK